MNLTPSPLRMIREGKKTIELRLYDEKRKAGSMRCCGDKDCFVLDLKQLNRRDLLFLLSF